MITTKDQARTATKSQIIEALRGRGANFKAKAPKAELVDQLAALLQPKRKPGVAPTLCQLFADVGTTITEKDLQAALPHASMTGSIRPWISSLKNPKYLPAGVAKPVVIKRTQADGETVYQRTA